MGGAEVVARQSGNYLRLAHAFGSGYTERLPKTMRGPSRLPAR